MNVMWNHIHDDSLKHIDKTIDFLRTEFHQPEGTSIWTKEYFCWKLGEKNPAGPGYISIALVDDTVVGVVSLTRKRLWVKGSIVIGGEVGDVYTSAKMRRGIQPDKMSDLDPRPESFINRSVFGRLASEVSARAQSAGLSIIYGTPNSNAYPGWTKRLGYFEFQGIGNRSYSRPTWRLIVKKYPGLVKFACAIKAVDLAIIWIQSWLWKIARPDLCFNEYRLNDQEIETLWDATKSSIQFSLVRDAKYWRYRYGEHPLFEYDFYSVRSRGVLVCIVVVRQDFSDKNRRVLYMAEWMSINGVDFGYVISQLLHEYRFKNIDVINFWAKDDGVDACASSRSLFLKRAMIPVILKNNNDGKDIAKIKEGLCFYLGSTDAV